MSNKPDVTGFLKELGELSTKYGIEIEGCGCCGSPFLMGPSGHLQFDRLEAANPENGVTTYTIQPL